MPSDLIRDRTGAAPYVTPFLDALDRMQEREVVQPDQLTARARALLNEHFGVGGGRPDAAFAHGGTGLLGEHTHYFDGFAVLMSLPLGTAVALRTTSAPNSHVVFEGGTDTWPFDPATEDDDGFPTWVRLVIDVVRRMAPPDAQVEAAVVSTIPSSCIDAYVGALGVASARACQSVFARSEASAELDAMVRDAVERCLEVPYSIAYVMASDSGRVDHYSLVDTNAFEQLPVDAPSRDVLGWGFVDIRMGMLRDPSFHAQRKQKADEATHVLRTKGFASMQSLRDLEHKDLKTALAALPRRLRPIVRHLVTENRRVQKLVGAVRRRDWQMFGALLLMSHASLQKDWESTNDLVDLAVREAEAMSLEGIYGACMTGRGGSVLVVGQPFIVPGCLDRIQEAIRAEFDAEAEVMLL